jgi:hypothetical protein
MLDVRGLTNTIKFSALKPCPDECMILSILASVEYDDGQRADASNGVSFKHIIFP